MRLFSLRLGRREGLHLHPTYVMSGGCPGDVQGTPYYVIISLGDGTSAAIYGTQVPEPRKNSDLPYATTDLLYEIRTSYIKRRTSQYIISTPQIKGFNLPLHLD